jgi:uncharacterized protein (TIGR02996 family)
VLFTADERARCQAIYNAPDDLDARLVLADLLLERGEVVELLERMEPDDATDILQNMTDSSRDRLLGTLGKVEAVKFRRLLEYPEKSAGGMMTTDYLAVRDTMSVREATEAIRRAEALGEDWLYVFVVDWRGRLQGRATMRALLKSGGAGVAPGGLTEGVLREMISGAVPAGSSGASAAALLLPPLDLGSGFVGRACWRHHADLTEPPATAPRGQPGIHNPILLLLLQARELHAI